MFKRLKPINFHQQKGQDCCLSYKHKSSQTLHKLIRHKTCSTILNTSLV